MILRALCELAKEKKLTEDLDFVDKPVRYQLVVTRDGRGTIVDLAEWEPGEGKRKPKLLVKPRRIPRQSGRTSGDHAEFLVDKCDYVFGFNPLLPEKTATKLPNRARLFREVLSDLQRSLAAGGEAAAAVATVLEFLRSPDRCQASFDALWSRASDDRERKDITTAMFELVYEPVSPVPLHAIPEIETCWKQRRAGPDGDSAGSDRCLVTGLTGVIADKHPIIQGVPGTLNSRSYLVSYNSVAFESYGLERNANAPISRDAAESYVNALNLLLSRGPTGQNLRLSDDSVAVFWARDADVGWFTAGLDSDDPGSVLEMLRTPQRGRPAVLDAPASFFSLVLGGSQGRCLVRSFLATTVSAAATSMARFLAETRIGRPFQDEGNYPLHLLVKSVGLVGSRETVVSSDLATRLYLSALRGTPYPETLLSAAVRRCQAEISADENRDRFKWPRFAARAALIRAHLIRNRNLEVTVSLDVNNRQPPYLLGRLFAILDRTQGEALGSISATTADRYYGSASSTPAAVFPTLLRRNQHHLSKLGKEKPGLAVVRDKLLTEVLGGLSSFKRTLTLEEQGLFALGFHHQRQDFFTKKETDHE